MIERRPPLLRGAAPDRPWWLPAITIEHLWVSAPFVLVLVFGLLKQAPLLDFWWHLKAGEVIVTTRSIPRTDIFSFTCGGAPFVHQNWLAEVIYYFLYRAGGLELLVVLNTILLLVALAAVSQLSLAAATKPRPALFPMFLVALMLLKFSAIRTQVFSFACFATVYWVLSSFRGRPVLLWTLPLVMLAWVNLHGAFVLGLGLVALFVACESLQRLVRGDEPDSMPLRDLRRLGAVLAVSVLATLVNPIGPQIYAAVAQVATDPISQSFVTEWQAPRLNGLGFVVFYGPFFLTLIVLVYSKQRPHFTELVLFLCFGALAATAVRNGIWLALIVAPIVARHLPGTRILPALAPLRRYEWIDDLVHAAHQTNIATSFAVPRYGLNTLIAAGLLATSLALSPWLRPRLGIKWPAHGLVHADTPVAAVDYMEAHHLEGRIFAPEIYGDYLIWRLWPQQRSFVDSRAHLFQECPAVANDYNLVFFDPHWEERLARHDVRYILLNKDGAENATMITSARASSHWQLLYEDERALLFTKTEA